MDRVDAERYHNYLELVAEGTWEAGYRNPQEFIERMGYDPKVWKIQYAKPNAWPTSGWNKEAGKPWTVINHQVRATCILREPEPVEPQIQPVTIRARPRKAKQRRTYHGLRTALIISDLHTGYLRDLKTNKLLPFHDRRALDIALQVAQRIRPHEIIINGDSFDLPDWSDKFIRSPEFYHTTQPAILELNWWLARFRAAAPDADIKMLEGNHDARLEKSLLVHLNNAYRLKPADEMELPASMTVPRLLALHKLDIEYVEGYPDATIWLSDRLAATHGPIARSAPGASAGALVRETDYTVIHGHIHRRERASRQIHGRNGQRTVEAVCPGCMCHIDGRVPGKKKRQNWQQGMAVVRYKEEYEGPPPITPIPIENGRAIFEGELYKGEPYLDQLRQDTDWPF